MSKCVVITGGAQGQGLSHAIAFAKQGFNVVIGDLFPPEDERVRRAREDYGVKNVKLESFVTKQDKYRASYYNFFTSGRWGAAANYDLCINSRLGLDVTARIVAEAARELDKTLS